MPHRTGPVASLGSILLLAAPISATRNAVNMLKTMVFGDSVSSTIPPGKSFDLSLIQKIKAESR